ncbi:radical SAM protein [Methanocaldococcus infernus]|uniref:radical SAM protein n=1 Tax=Methanocaldococcus infernus TaxID=67760 RepID=UPI0001A811A8|nr:radical SAM protein [Methanocaldococcus infernus]
MIKNLYRKHLSKIKFFKILANFIYYKKRYKFSLLDILKNRSIMYFILEIKKETMPLPFFVQIEPTTKCNLNCEFCTRKTLPDYRLNKDINLELVKKILKENPNLKIVKLQGLGESTISNNLKEIAEILKSKDIYLITVVNGTTLIHEKIRQILLRYFDEIIISIDSVDEETFERIRKGAKFKNVIQGLKNLIKENQNFKRKIKINYVFSHLNYKEIPKAIEFFESLGVDKDY